MRRAGAKAGSNRTLCAALMALACLISGLARADFKQDRFIIGFWGDPPVDGRVNARYVEVADAGFNLVMGGMGASSPALAQRQRDACNRVNIQVLFATYGLPISALCNCETTYGFLIRDHPSVNELDRLKARAFEARRDRPGKLPFINLFPPSTPPEKLGAPDYKSYLSAVMEALRPEVLCCDELPWRMQDGNETARYLTALGMLRQAALQQGVPFWIFVQAMAYGTDYVPSEADIRWQVYTALAYGAKGILYFSYATPPADPEVKGTGLIDTQGRRTERYGVVSTINRELKRLGVVFFRAAPVGVFDLREAGMSQAQSLTEAAPVRISEGAEVIAGVARDTDGSLVLCLASQNRKDSIALDVVFEGAVRELDRAKGEMAPLSDDDAVKSGFQLHLAPGDARVFVIGRPPA